MDMRTKTLADGGIPARIAKALKADGITTIGDIARRTRGQIALVGGIDGHDVAEIARILAGHRLGYIDGVGSYLQCKTCPRCTDCGMPRTSDARNVVVDVRGRAKHVGAPGKPCDGCDSHHRQLVANAAGAAVAA